MATPEDFGPYEGLLHQADVWPSTDKGNIAILDMSPQYAISAYRKLCRWAQARPDLDEMRTYLLGHALIIQALGHAPPEEEHQASQLEDEELIEMLIEASAKATEADAVFHYRLARTIVTYLDDHLVVVYQQQ